MSVLNHGDREHPPRLGGRGAESAAVPELLTQDEAIALLRLGDVGVADPKESLRYLRRTRQLGYVKVAGKVLIPRAAVQDYLERQEVKALP